MAGTAPDGSLETVDITDPCALCAVLNRVYLLLIAGMREIRVMFRDGESQEQVDYSQPSLPRVAQERAKANMACAALQSGRPTRRAITAG